MSACGYQRVKNNHIFIQLNVGQLKNIRKIIDMKHQRIHIFDLYPTAISNIIQRIIDISDHTTTIIIHIPKLMIDYERVLKNTLKNDDHKKVRYSIDSKPVEFIIKRSDAINMSGRDCMNMSYLVGYSKVHKYYKLEGYIYSESDRYILDMELYSPSGDGVFKSVHQINNPQLFKDVILKNFKKSCPKGILTNFRDDEDIWRYITWDNEKEGGSWYDRNVEYVEMVTNAALPNE